MKQSVEDAVEKLERKYKEIRAPIDKYGAFVRMDFDEFRKIIREALDAEYQEGYDRGQLESEDNYE